MAQGVSSLTLYLVILATGSTLVKAGVHELDDAARALGPVAGAGAEAWATR